MTRIDTWVLGSLGFAFLGTAVIVAGCRRETGSGVASKERPIDEDGLETPRTSFATLLAALKAGDQDRLAAC